MSRELQPGQVNIQGKVYDTVALRVRKMREEHPDWSIETEMVSIGVPWLDQNTNFNQPERVVFKATIRDGDGKLVSTGYAEEERSPDGWLSTSAIEVCETSAVGRALGNAFWQGSEAEFDPQIATADEVGTAIRKQADKMYGQYMQKVWEHWDSIVAIKQHLAVDELPAAAEAWREIGHDDMIKLWKAPTKGGIFTIKERELLKQIE